MWDVNEQWVRENKDWMKANDVHVVQVATPAVQTVAQEIAPKPEEEAIAGGEYAPVEVAKVETKKVQKSKQK